MKRASYRYAVCWIAAEDSAADADAMDPERVAELVTTLLIADLFGVDPERVGRDVVRERKKKAPASRDGAYWAIDCDSGIAHAFASKAAYVGTAKTGCEPAKCGAPLWTSERLGRKPKDGTTVCKACESALAAAQKGEERG